MTVMRIDKAFKKVHFIYDSCQSALEKINELQSDELFVSLEVIFGKDFEKIDDWLFENNIVAKKENFQFKIPHTDVEFIISGYRLRNVKHAMAFKLRWYNER